MSDPSRTLPDVVVSSDWVADHLDGVVLADVRFYLDGRSPREEYLKGHLPGAVFVDLDADLSAPPSGDEGNHPLPSPARFAERLGALGIGDDDVVISYDDSGGATAGRLAFMLRVIGQSAAVLDGGIRAWGGPVEIGDEKQPTKTTRREIAWPARYFATYYEVTELGPDSVHVDARGAARYHSPDEPGKPGGHIPTAQNLPWNDLVDEKTGRILDKSALRETFSRYGIDDTSTVIASCGSGVSACADLTALEYAGFHNVKLFVPSFSGWSADQDRPREH